MSNGQRRVAERILVEPQLEGMLAEYPGSIGEIATLGCRFEHVPRLAIGTTLPLSLRWEGIQISLQTKIVWSELKLSGGDKYYHSGLQFGDASPEALGKLRSAFEKHVKRTLSALFPDLPLEKKPKRPSGAVPFMSTPFLAAADEPAKQEVPSGFMEFRLRGDRWDMTAAEKDLQPRDGLAFPNDFDPGEIEIWKRCYQDAVDPVRRMLRAALELRLG